MMTMIRWALVFGVASCGSMGRNDAADAGKVDGSSDASSEDVADGPDADATDAVDGGDLTDATDAGDGTDATDGSDPDGAKLFVQTCAACHVADARGGQLGPSLRYVPRGFGEYTVRHGRDEMPYAVPMQEYTPALLDDASLGAILDHLHTLPRPTDGQGLFEMLCSNCHGTDGRGGRVGKDLRGEGHEVSEKVRNGEQGNDYSNDDYMPSWPTAELSDAELALIRTYVDSL